METKHTKGKWERRRLFEIPILVEDKENNKEWYSNEISIHEEGGRVVCDVKYMTDTPNQGWGRTNNIPEWEANARLIAAAPEMLEALLSIENDDNSIPAAIWEMINAAIKKATE